MSHVTMPDDNLEPSLGDDIIVPSSSVLGKYPFQLSAEIDLHFQRHCYEKGRFHQSFFLGGRTAICDHVMTCCVSCCVQVIRCIYRWLCSGNCTF